MATNKAVSLSELINDVANELRLAQTLSQDKSPVMEFTLSWRKYLYFLGRVTKKSCVSPHLSPSISKRSLAQECGAGFVR